MQKLFSFCLALFAWCVATMRFTVRAPMTMLFAVGTGTGSAYPTLLEISKQWGKDGKPLPVVEMLAQTNEPLIDIPWKGTNETAGERSAIRTGLPYAIFRQFYQGTPTGKSTTVQIVDATCMMEARGEVDVKLANLNGNSAAWRMQENYAFIEAMNQKMMAALMYGNAAINPTQFNGFAPRFSVAPTNANPAANSANVIDAGGVAGGTALLTSIWLICWGPLTAYGIYPKGSQAGILHKDLQEIDAFDDQKNAYRVYADLYNWDCGLVVKDWRYIVRICNIDTNKLITGQGAPDLTALMVKALHRPPNLGIVQTGQNNPAANGAPAMPLAPNPVFYCNRTIAEYLDIQSLNKTQYTLKSGNDVFGRPITFCRGIPVRTCDQILSTEGQVV